MEQQQTSGDEPQTSSVVTSRPRTTHPSDAQSWLMVAGAAGQIGYLLAIPAVLFVLGGAWLDSYLGTKPIFTLAGIPIALTISVISVWRVIVQLQGRNGKWKIEN